MTKTESLISPITLNAIFNEDKITEIFRNANTIPIIFAVQKKMHTLISI